MIQDFEYLQDMVDSLEAETLNASAELITFGGGWQGIASGNFESSLSPVKVIGRILRFQLEHGIPILSRRDIISEGICRRPPVLPLYAIEPGRVYSLEHLTDQIRVVVLGFFDWHQNRRHFQDYIESQRGGVPFFGLYFKKRTGCGFDETPSIAIVKASALEVGYLFASGDNQGAGVDGLLIGLWRQLMEKSFPHYQ